MAGAIRRMPPALRDTSCWRDWARAQGIGHIALGHTQDDQAETVLMGLARASGVDGLSAMAARREDLGICWHRPMLAIPRAGLRGYLNARGVAWCEDPSNEDARFERIKARRALTMLADLGIDRASLAQVARNMGQSRSALEHQTRQAAQDLIRLRGGGASLSWAAFNALPAEIARRLLIAAIDWIAAPPQAPRQKAFSAAMAEVQSSNSATVGGCRLIRQGDAFWIFREFNAVAEQRRGVSEIWDGRWQITGDQSAKALKISALGESGLRQCRDWRATGLPRALLAGTPAVWQGDDLIAAPIAQHEPGWRAELIKRPACLFDQVFGH